MQQMSHLVLCLLAFSASVLAAPFGPGSGLLPSGNLRTVDNGGPYDLTALNTQAAHVKAAIAARGEVTDKDIIDFLTNVECVEGRFDTYGTQGKDFTNDLLMGGPTSKGFAKANLSPRTRTLLEEVALSEQGHALFTRQAGSTIPCPYVDYDAGFNGILAAAYGLAPGETIEKLFGKKWDPYVNDATFTISMLTLEELGATGNKGLASIMTNPILQDGLSGLACTATAFAAIERSILFDLRDEIVPPTNETVAQVFARISAYRDSMDGPQFDDQGLLNTDARMIAVPESFVNNIPTDVRGLSFARTPQMNLNILMLGAQNGKGGFFPKGIQGKINTPVGFDKLAEATEDWTGKTEAEQMSVKQLGEIPPPITQEGPSSVPGMKSLTQDFSGPQEDETYLTRGYETPSKGYFRSSVDQALDTLRQALYKNPFYKAPEEVVKEL
ncbi:hypothetical protein WJX84_012323 [Apatococcus fuscideae]|uniref:Uncharacterized protein n=1 Tax=Apatococcus fuscideae TaxID=2026836 RepID=A0AAW1T9P3_9CHLO